MLEKMVRLRSEVIKPYIQELDRNVSSRGVPTMRPLAYEVRISDCAQSKVHTNLKRGPLTVPQRPQVRRDQRPVTAPANIYGNFICRFCM